MDCRDPIPGKATQLASRFDRIFRTRTRFAKLDRLLARIWADRPSFLRILQRPDLPLHTNGSENDIRSMVTRRKISGGTKSENGRDAMSSIRTAYRKLGISFWDYLGDRLRMPGAKIPPLPALVVAS